MTLRAQLEAAEAAALAGGATLLKVSTEVRIGGVMVPGCLGWTVDHGLDIINSTASLTFAVRPSQAEELAAVEIWAGYNGYLSQIFAGEVVAPSWDYAPATATVECRAKLARVRANWGGDDQVWDTIDDAALIVAILELYGITNHNIESSGWTLGTIQDITLANGESGWALIEEIDRLAGYLTFSAPDGWTHRRRVSGAPGTGYVWRYAKGKNILGAKRTRTLDGIYNKAVVSGLEYEGVSVSGSASAANPYIPPTPGYITLEEESDLIEDDTKAQEIAERTVGDKNRRPEAMDLTVAGNPLLHPAATIQADHDDLETGVANLLIQHISHSLSASEMTTAIQTTGGTLSGYNASAPVVQFTIQIFREYDTGAAGPVYVVIATSTSFDPDGDEGAMTEEWTISGTGGTPDPLTGSGRVFRSVLPGTMTDFTITLDVTDVDGLSASQTRGPIALEEDALSYDTIYFASDTLAGVSSDGEQTWQTQTIPGGATTSALAPFAPPWGELWGASNGHAYGTFDNLQSALVDFGQPCGTADEITAVWCHELDDTRLWAANSAGLVAFGLLDIAAQTVTWTIVTAIGQGPVKEIREAYSVFGALKATAGTGYYGSEDGGATWTQLDTGDTSWRMTAGWDENLYSFLNDAEPLRSEAGTTVTFPVLVPPVEHIRGLTMGWRVRAAYVVDDQARLFQTDGNLLNFEHVTTNSSGANHMLRSGNIDGKIYLACDDGIYAWMPDTGYLAQIYASAAPVAMLGYNSLAVPPPVEALVLRGGKGGVWRLTDDPVNPWEYLAFGIAGTETIQFNRVVADPNNQDRWMALYNGDPGLDGGNKLVIPTTSISPVLETDDHGLTWHEVELTLSLLLTPNSSIRLAYDYVNAGWKHIAMAPGQGGAGSRASIRYWGGTANNLGTDVNLLDVTPGDYSYFHDGRLHGIEPTFGGDLIFAVNSTDGPTYAAGLYWRADGASIFADLAQPHSDIESNHGVDSLKGDAGLSAAMVSARSALGEGWSLRATPDARVALETLKYGPFLEDFNGFTTTLNDVVIATDTELRSVSQIFGSPVESTVYTLSVGSFSGAPRAGRRYRTAIGIAASGDRTVVSDDGGSTWAEIAPPATYPDLTPLDYFGVTVEMLEVD